MQPNRGSSFITLPMSFDSGTGTARIKRGGVKLWLFLATVLWVLFSIFGIALADGIIGYTSPLWLFFIFSYIIRYLIVRERFYRAKRRELQKNDFTFQHNLFWNIYDYSYRYPYFISFENGMKGVFVAFDNGVVIGKGEHSSFDHFEGLANAYSEVLSKNIEIIHVDYMDIAGRDSRLDHLYNLAENAENPDIKRVLMRMADHTSLIMSNIYASYDVYCFYSRGGEEQFWHDLEPALNTFLTANYLRYRVLDREQVVPFVESVMNLSEFSVNRANDMVFRKLNRIVEYIRPIWVEKGGERKVLNRTLEQIEEERRVTQAESKVKRRGNIITRNKDAEVEVDIFNTKVSVQGEGAILEDKPVQQPEKEVVRESENAKSKKDKSDDSDDLDLFS